ncbi:MAG TPA: redoxin domain-containing protein [Thiobacillaceae bacterium]|nr:redoxin domain-containing protein [Thiobacillaceae bacterium]HNU64315.1 redoxin domain-containing protein [Thiobacillaceae bacterium]
MQRCRPLALALFLVCLLCAAGTGATPTPAGVGGKKTIPFRFVDLQGRNLRLEDFRGKWVLVNFWAYWCPMCRIGIPTLNKLSERADLVVIGISLDYGDDVNKVREAVDLHGLRYTAQVAGGNRRDPNSPYRQVGPVDFFPTSYLYDPDGEIVMFIPGQLRRREILAYMDNWRAERGGPAAQLAYGMDLQKFETALTRRYGSSGAETFRQWHNLRAELAKTGEDRKLAGINDFINQRVRHMDARQAWGQADHWATPAETLGAGRGDSRDIAVAKYFTLLSLDVPEDRLRLMYTHLGEDSRGSRDPVHMVLAYYPVAGGEPLVLDDHIPEIRPASLRGDLRPVFSFNGQSVLTQPGTSPYNLSAWQKTVQRARAEGFE